MSETAATGRRRPRSIDSTLTWVAYAVLGNYDAPYAQTLGAIPSSVSQSTTNRVTPRTLHAQATVTSPALDRV